MNDLEKMIMKLSVEYAKLELVYLQALQKIRELENSLGDK